MAGVFTVLFIFFLSGFIYFIKFHRSKKKFNLVQKILLGLFAFGILVLLFKFLIEKLIPCYFVNKRYCDFTSTTYSYCKLEYLGCRKPNIKSIDTYTECGRAGFEIIKRDTYICIMPDGKAFRQDKDPMYQF